MRQEYQSEQRAGHQCNRCEKTEVAEHVAFREKQSEECTDGSDAAQAHRCGFVFQDSFHIPYIFIMREDMENVTDCNSENYGSDTERHQGHAAFHEIDAGQ